MNFLLRDELATILTEELSSAGATALVRDSEIAGHLPVLDRSPRARNIRRIAEISQSRGWQLEVVRALDRHDVSYIEDLSDEAIASLRDRMEYLEDCVQTCCDPDDAPPAR